MKYHFVTQQLLDKVSRRADEMAAKWDYPKEQYWQLWQMIATVEIGMAKATRFEDGGIVVRGWNDGGFLNPDPNIAWGGFYRLERNQMVGNTLWLVKHAEDKDAELMRVAPVYGFYSMIWENESRVWGYRGYQDYYDEKAANDALEAVDDLLGNRMKRGTVRYLELSGMYRVEVEATQKPALDNVHRERIVREAL